MGEEKRVKICGICSERDAAFVNESKPDFAGFVFVKGSRRFVTAETAKKLREIISVDIKTVGVFVNAPQEEILLLEAQKVIDLIQLHGDETVSYVESLKQKTKLPIIKAIRVKDEKEVVQSDLYPCDFLLFDTYRKGTYGGTGECFSWDMVPKKLQHPFFLAGGISIENLEEALLTNCYGIDVSGGAETEGKKDIKKMKQIVQFVKRLGEKG